jgi:cell wall-associated NlpC family hydrolase
MRKVLRSTASLVAAGALAATTFAVAAEPAGAAPACRLNFSHYATVKVGNRGVGPAAAECLLRGAGYKISFDGSFSKAESVTLKRFQQHNHVRATGVVDKATWTALLSHGSRPRLTKGARGDAVRRVQRALVATGRHLKITGVYDGATVNAIKGLQRAKRGWHQTGVTGALTWQILQNGSAASLPILGPSPARHAATTSNRGARALAYAKKHLGARYRYGASGPNAFDCSGLTMAAWRSAGVNLPHSARAQFSKGKKVAKSNLRPGDLVFFYRGISHVAIYAGNGKVIHASRPGAPVAYIQMKYMPYQGARRPG